jgi:hypothetical protein
VPRQVRQKRPYLQICLVSIESKLKVPAHAQEVQEQGFYCVWKEMITARTGLSLCLEEETNGFWKENLLAI